MKEMLGQLPPDAQDQLDAAVRGWRESGLVTHIEILGPGDCVAAAALEGVLFPLDSPPSLPIAGCERSPCCGCCYMAVLDDEGGMAARKV